MSAGPFVGDLFVDVAQTLLHLPGRHSGLFQPVRTIGDQGFKNNRIAGMDVQHRLGGGIVVAPGNRGGRSFQGIGLRGLGQSNSRGQEKEDKRAHKIFFIQRENLITAIW